MDAPKDAIKQIELLNRGGDHDDWRWLTKQLLERAHWELERADEKANTHRPATRPGVFAASL
jgi:hypothetical protein